VSARPPRRLCCSWRQPAPPVPCASCGTRRGP